MSVAMSGIAEGRRMNRTNTYQSCCSPPETKEDGTNDQSRVDLVGVCRCPPFGRHKRQLWTQVDVGSIHLGRLVLPQCVLLRLDLTEVGNGCWNDSADGNHGQRWIPHAGRDKLGRQGKEAENLGGSHHSANAESEAEVDTDCQRHDFGCYKLICFLFRCVRAWSCCTKKTRR